MIESYFPPTSEILLNCFSDLWIYDDLLWDSMPRDSGSESTKAEMEKPRQEVMGAEWLQSLASVSIVNS